MPIRALDPVTDFALVGDLYLRAADYLLLESGRPPDDAVVEEFFTEAPPNVDPATSLHFGLFADRTPAPDKEPRTPVFLNTNAVIRCREPEDGVVRQNHALAAIANMSFGFPETGDAYIGLMLIAPEFRNRGIGPRLLSHLFSAARARSATRMLLAVLDANPRGHAFWLRMGFADTAHRVNRQFGDQTHGLVRMMRPL